MATVNMGGKQVESADLDQFKNYLQGGNYQGAADIGNKYGFSNNDIAGYAGSLGVKDVTFDNALNYLNTQYKPSQNSLLNPAAPSNSISQFNSKFGAPTTPSYQPTTGAAPTYNPGYTTMAGKYVSNADVDAFKTSLQGGNYAAAQQIGSKYGFSNQDLAGYAGSLGIKDVTTENALAYLNSNQYNPANATDSFTSKFGSFNPSANTQGDPNSPIYQQKAPVVPDASKYLAKVPNVNASGLFNIGTNSNPYYVNPMSAAGTDNLQNKFMTPEQYAAMQSGLPTTNPMGFKAQETGVQSQQIMDFTRANGVTPQQAQVFLANQSQNVNANGQNINAATTQVGANDLSQNQLANITAQDSPLMQLAKQSGNRLAANRGLLNSSISAGAAQAEMVKAAQPFALQDAQTYSTTRLANQQAENQVNLANQANRKDIELANQSQANQVNLANAQTQNQNAQYNATNDVNTKMQAAQSGFDTAKANLLQNNDTLNKADLAKLANQLDMNATYAGNAQKASSDINAANIASRQALQAAMLDRSNTYGNNVDQNDINASSTNQKNDSAILANQLQQNLNSQLAGFDVAKANNQNYFDQWSTQFKAAADQQVQAITEANANRRAEIQANTSLLNNEADRQKALVQSESQMKTQAVTSGTNLMNTFMQQMQQISTNKEVPAQGKQNAQLQIAASMAPYLNNLNAIAGIPDRYTPQSLVNAWGATQSGANITQEIVNGIPTK